MIELFVLGALAVAGLIAAKIMDRAQPTVGTVH